jgi:transposase-like protein
LAAQAAASHGAAWTRTADWTGRIDEAYIGGLEEGVRGRHTEKKALIAVAAEEDGRGIERICTRQIPEASADSFQAFVEEAVEPGALVHTDAWLSYDRLSASSHVSQGSEEVGLGVAPARLSGGVALEKLLKRWLLGTHQGAVSRANLDYYLDEFTFRFNCRTSRHRGKLFYRLVQQAVAVGPAPYPSLVRHLRPQKRSRRRHNK